MCYSFLLVDINGPAFVNQTVCRRQSLIHWYIWVLALPHGTPWSFLRITLSASDRICFSFLSLYAPLRFSTHPPVCIVSLWLFFNLRVLVRAAGTTVVKASHGAWPRNWETYHSSIQSLQEVRGHRSLGGPPCLPQLLIKLHLSFQWLQHDLNKWKGLATLIVGG